MAFKHPPPWLYWIAFGAPLFIGLTHAFKLWQTSSDDTSIFVRVAITIVAAIAPLAGLLLIMAAFAYVMLHLGTPRKGNRIVITGGEYAGKNAIVMKRHGFTDFGPVHVRLMDDEIDVTISNYHFKKIGVWSHIF